jgi:hypothetical protein
MLKLFGTLEIKHYEIVPEKVDFYDPQEVDIGRSLYRSRGTRDQEGPFWMTRCSG